MGGDSFYQQRTTSPDTFFSLKRCGITTATTKTQFVEAAIHVQRLNWTEPKVNNTR